MMPSGHKAFLVNNTREVDLLLMHSKIFAAEYDSPAYHQIPLSHSRTNTEQDLTRRFIKKESRNCRTR
jgi:hypothetical protein